MTHPQALLHPFLQIPTLALFCGGSLTHVSALARTTCAGNLTCE